MTRLTNSNETTNSEDEDASAGANGQQQVDGHRVDYSSSRINDQQQQQSSSEHYQDLGDNSNNSDSSKPKRNPFCSRCRNHGKKAQVKGHKRHCEYRDCQCHGCRLVACRQLVSAAQIKRRRDLKQDEECGRCIKISPPVLAQEPNTDPAALIAETLIGGGPSAAKHLSLQETATVGQPIAKAHHNFDLHLHHLQQPTTNCTHLNHSHLNQLQGQLQSPKQGSMPLNVTTTTEYSTSHQQSMNALNGTNQINHQHQLSTNSHHGPQQQEQQRINPSSNGSPVSSALNNALHLFHFPNLSAAAAASLAGGGHSPAIGSQLIMPPAPSSSSAPTTLAASSPVLPSVREQLALVEEIYNSCGPLAIYAWLRDEKFNLQRVRDLIEASEVSYNHLLELKTKLHLNNYNSASSSSSASNSSNDHHNLHMELGFKSGSQVSSKDNRDDKGQEKMVTICGTMGGTSSPSANCSNTSSASSYEAPTIQTSATIHPTTSSSSASSLSSSSSSPLYTIGNSFTCHCNNSSSANGASSSSDNSNNNYINNSIYTNSSRNNPSSTVTSAAADHHQHNMSLASTLNSLPMSTAARGLLWPSLKMPAGSGSAAAAAAAASIHPHHFLPHFMSHHLFGPTTAHHQHHQQHQHYLQLVSPARHSTISNLSQSTTAAAAAAAAATALAAASSPSTVL